MPIILAIEPDRRQREALSAVVRHRVGAELILADTTEHALEAIGNRVPDLVLVPALLSPQDDAALAAALRVIAAAAHVRTLTIPLLAAYTEEAPRAGLLSRWRKGKSAPATDGCDPAVFAEQILSYLKESAAERAQRVDDEDRLQSREPVYAQEFEQEDVPVPQPAYGQADAQAYVRADADAFVETDLPAFDQTYSQPEVQSYQQPYAFADAAYAPAEVADAQSDVAYTQPDVQAYAQPDVAYAQPDVQAYAQPDVAYAQPDGQAWVETDAQLFSEPESQVDAQPAAQPGLQTGDFLQADRDLHQQEDIDLSDELSELEGEESDGAVRDETIDIELFDGEPVGVYTLSSDVDEPDVDLPLVPARGFSAGAVTPAGPVLAADALADSSFEADAAVDPEFFYEPFAPPVFAAQPRSQPVFEDEAAVARAFEDETDAGAATVAEPSPFLSPRRAWPTMEGVPTEPPAAFAAAAAVTEARAVAVEAHPEPAPAAAAEARPAPVPHKRDRPEWSELVASLRKDIERRRVEPPQEKPKANTPVQAPRRSKKAKPVQDEWGFFDPEQCGFAALLAKLDEITEGVEDTKVGQP